MADGYGKMVRFVDKPYMTDAVSPKIGTLKWKMAVGIGMTGVHFITLSDNKKDIFDIYPAAVFKQRHIRRSDRVILGVAHSYSSATDLIARMIEDCLRERGDLLDVRSYFEDFVKEHL